MARNLSRRDFLKGAACSMAGAMLFSGCSSAETTTTAQTTESSAEVVSKQPEAPVPYTYADTIAWDGIYDVLVMGFGGAGATAAHYAAETGANVLLFDAAPEGHEGGNTRYAGQFCVVGRDKDKLLTYYKALYGGMAYDEELLKVFTEDLTVLGDRMIADYGTTELMYWKGIPATAWAIPEFPEFEGCDTIDSFSVHMGASDGALWRTLQQKAMGRDNIDIWYNSRGRKLIQDPENKTILGVTIERNGELINIRANNGVVMACGGFENNQRMVNDYLGIPFSNARGTLYNRGDGISMALDVNADLWHMDCHESLDILGGHCIATGQGERATLTTGFKEGGSFILVGPDGSRFLNETEYSRHGHIYHCGEYHLPSYPKHAYLILDKKMRDSLEQAGTLEANLPSLWIKASSLNELANLTGMDADRFTATVRKYNQYVQMQEDYEYNRTPETMTALDDGECYAIKMNPFILNTQGGARRNSRAEVLDVDGNAIPHLYSAGEFGGLTAKNYQGATNLSECLVFGRIAGLNAAEVKADLPIYTQKAQVTSDLQYQIGCSDEGTSNEDITLKDNEYLGTSNIGMGGEMVVKVTMDGSTIAAIEIIKHNESTGISDPAIEKIPAAIIASQSTEIDVVSGASLTSRAIIAAVNDALAQVK